MRILDAQFITSAAQLADCPPPSVPEVAFAGRSNVGKSSLINYLLNRKKLAKVSVTPGKTRLLNFFLINRAFHLVDLPGYGWAKVPMELRKQWGPMIEGYITGRPTLRAVVVLLDARREPSPEDVQLIEWLKFQNIPSVLVLTKVDAIAKTRRVSRVRDLAKALQVPPEILVITSVLDKIGRDQVWSKIAPF